MLFVIGLIAAALFRDRGPVIDPGGVEECSHGWSAAQPVEREGKRDEAPEGRRKAV
jgi:hypothetical protein